MQEVKNVCSNKNDNQFRANSLLNLEEFNKTLDKIFERKRMKKAEKNSETIKENFSINLPSAIEDLIDKKLNGNLLDKIDINLIDGINNKIVEKLKDLPLQINIYLNLHQTQNPEQIAIGHVDNGAVAVKHSNAVDNPVNSAIAQAHSNAVDNPVNSAVALDDSNASDNPTNSAVAQDDSNSSDNPSNSAVAQDDSNASDNPTNSAVALEDSNASDNPLLSDVDQNKLI